jgi:tetratricopeptide (TPR) repeat protein
LRTIRTFELLLSIGSILLFPPAAAQVASPQKSQLKQAKPNQPEQRGLEHPEIERPLAAELSGKTYALLIGVSHYKNDPPIISLQYADHDAQTFAELLKAPIGGSLREPDDIQLLINEKATRAAIDDAVKQLRSAHGGPQNTLIIFIGAHGVYLTEEEDPITHRKIQKDPYILLYDTNTQDAKTTGYPMVEFRRMVAEQAMTFGRVLVFLDVCHAANVAGIAGGSEVQDSVQRAWQGQAGELGLMMASHAGESAIESSAFGGGHGAFTYFLLSGLDGPAGAGDTAITFADLAEYVRANVRKYTRKAQDPFDQAPNTDMIVVPDTRKPGITLAPARPLSEQELRDIRRRRGDSPRGSSTQPQQVSTQNAFESAIERGLLLPEEPGSASNMLASYRRDPSQSPEANRERERQLRVALEDRGQDVMSRYLEGEEVPLTKADFDRCQRYFEEALALGPRADFDRSRALFCQGRADVFAGQYDDAQRLLEASIRIDSQRAYAYNALGIAYLERIARTDRGFDDAETAFRKAMRYAPYWAYPVHNLALVYSERGDYDGAIRLYQYAMSIAPRYSYLPYNLGLLYERLGDFDNAQLWFDKAREVLERFSRPSGSSWPQRARIWNALGTVARAQGRDSRALTLFRRALLDDPQDNNTSHNTALLLTKQSQFREADDLWRSVIARDPDFLPSRVAYAESLAGRGQRAAAIEQYEKIVSEKPNYVGAREALAGLYLAQNEPERALVHLNRVLVESLSNAILLEFVGDAEMQLGHVDASRSDWKRAYNATADRAIKTRLKQKLRNLR